jgi:signal transduction histidine kinase
MMFTSLRSRLLLSNLILLTVVIGGIILAFIVASGSQPAPPQPTYQRLAGLMQGLNLTNLITEFGPITPDGSPANDVDFIDLIDQFAEARDVRVLLVDVNRERLVWDSVGDLDAQESIRLEVDNSYRLPYRMRAPLERDPVFGKFIDDGATWLFAGVSTRDVVSNRYAIIVADVRPTQSLRALLAEFGTAWMRPVLIAIGIGLMISVGLSWLMTRTITRPLRDLGEAVEAVARGDLDHQVPVSGPSEMRSVAHAFNLMSEEVRATQQAQHDFMANVTHDLKTPLTSIQGYSQAIMDGTARDQSKAAEIIHDEAGRLTRMVSDLTDLARVHAGRTPLRREPVDLSQIVQTVSQKLSVVADRRDIALTTHIEPVPQVMGDGDQLVQVLNNLLGNAIKYTRGGGTVRVSLWPANDGGVLIQVADNGIGIPEADLPRIFERFYQVDKARGPSRGTGLGLAIVNEIVHAHEGRINVTSKPGSGTTFTVWLPVLASPTGP